MAAICEKWEVRATVIGTVTEPEPDGGGRLRIRDGMDGPVLADVPAASLSDDAPLYDRPRRAPEPGAGAAASTRAARPTAPPISSRCVRSPRWVYRQYDHQLFFNTVAGPGADAALLRLAGPGLPPSARGVALTTDSNPRACALDPRGGTALVLAEGVANLACVGATPVAVVNCLNFGNPEHPEVMWQLSECIDGMAEACRALALPVIGGNVSFYNESGGADIDPTPVLGVLGLVDALHARGRPDSAGPRATPWSCSVRRVPLRGDGAASRSRARAGPPSGAATAAGRVARRRLRRARVAVRLRRRPGRRAGGRAGPPTPSWCARGARRLGRRPRRRPGRDGGRGRSRLRADARTTPPSCSPSCRRASWWRPATLTGSGARAGEAGIPAAVLGRAGGDRVRLGRPGRPPRGGRARRHEGNLGSALGDP